jgi:hypothetical protein
MIDRAAADALERDEPIPETYGLSMTSPLGASARRLNVFVPNAERG